MNSPTATARLSEAGADLSRVKSWVDSRFGPIREMSSFRLVGPDPAWSATVCTLARAPTGGWHGDHRAGAAGTSTDQEEAFERAAGELLERYSALNAPVEGESMFPDLTGLLGRFPRCAHDEPCPVSLRAVDPKVPITHVAVTRLSGGRDVWIPAAHVHLGFWPTPPEPLVTLPISTGLAFHRSLEQAIWNGLCEVAERDALMLTWWLRRPAPELDCSGEEVPEQLVDRLKRVEAVNLRARLFDITSDFGVPTVFCVLMGERYPYAVTGAACRADPATACTKALDEAVAARVALWNYSRAPAPSLETFDWVEQLEHHSLLYADGALAHALDFLCASTARRVAFAEFAGASWWDSPTGFGSLRAFASQAEERGWTILYSDVTAPEVAPFGNVVKVVVPEMVPLSQSHRARWLATPRLVAAAGLTQASRGDFNPFPHPFA